MVLASKKLPMLLGSFAALSFAIAPAPASAFVVTIPSGVAEGKWNISFFTGKADENVAGGQFLDSQPWWNQADTSGAVAQQFANAFRLQGGLTDSAFESINPATLNFASRTVNRNFTRTWRPGTTVASDQDTSSNGNFNYATATQIPGPLPVLGAFAAFGWSRRMRQRIRLQQGSSVHN